MKKEERKYTAKEIKLSELRNNKIPNDYLVPLLVEYKTSRELDPKSRMGRELAEVLLIVIEKNLGSASWRNYSPDWKQEFREKAQEHVVKYAHSFNPEKSNDAYNYFATMVRRAFIQALMKCKEYAKNNISIDHDIIFKESNWTPDNEIRLSATIDEVVEVDDTFN